MFGKVLNRALISFLTIVNTIKGLLKMPKIFPVQANVAYIFLIDLYSQREGERKRERERERERERVYIYIYIYIYIYLEKMFHCLKINQHLES